jgi:Kef-type K+ transport system membrane component KefB
VTGTRLIATWRGNLAQPFPTLLLQVIVILALARLCRSVARRAGQPPVLGEMAAGIVLGPSLVGTDFPAFFESVFPADSLGPLQLLSQIGIMGMDWNTAFTLGALRNTRGLMELIALNVGYELGVISPRVFTALVLMALTTTAMTGPLVDFFGAKQAAAERYRASSLPGGCN